MAARTKREKVTTLEEVPQERLRELLAEGHTQVLCYFKRHTVKGTFESLPSRAFALQELLTDSVERYLEENHGGGSFIVDPRDSQMHDVPLCVRYRIVIAGQPKMQQLTGPTVAPTIPETLAGFQYRGYPPTTARDGVRPSDFMSATPDAIALNQVHELRTELKQARAEHRQELAKLAELLENERKEKARAHEVLLQERATAREQNFEQQINALRDAIRNPAKPTFDLTAMAAVLSAAVPVVTAWISSSRDRQQAMLNAQTKSSEQQQLQSDRHMTLLTTLLKPNDKEKNGTMELLGMLLPKLLEANNPSRMTEALATMGESQMTMMSLAAQMLQSLAPEADSPGMAFAREVLNGVVGFAEQMAPALKPGQATQLPRQPQQQVPDVHAEVVKPSLRPAARPPRTPQELARAIVAAPEWPEDLRGTHWLRLLTVLHDSRSPGLIGGDVAQLLQGFFNEGKLPPRLAILFDEDGPKPSEVLRPLFAILPIGQVDGGSRLVAVLAAIDECILSEDVDEADAAEDAAAAELEQPVGPNGAAVPTAGAGASAAHKD